MNFETSRHIPRDLNPHYHCCENLKCHIIQSSLCTQMTCVHSYEFGHCNINYNLKIKIQRTIILPVILNGCEIWLLTLREEHRLKVFENRVLRRIFGPKRDKVIREWRKLHSEELNDLYSSSNIVQVIKSRKMRWGDM